MVRKIISGGQTGAARGGLEAARALGLESGGWAPNLFATEIGPDLSLRWFGLREGGGGREHRRRNVADADATVVFACRPSPSSQLVARYATTLGKAYRVINPFAPDALARLRAFLAEASPRVLNVDGHRESSAPGIRDVVRELLVRALDSTSAGTSVQSHRSPSDRASSTSTARTGQGSAPLAPRRSA
jgi:hypothetical protein